MSIAQRLVNLSDGLSAEGILSAAKGGTGTTTGAGSSTPTISAIGYGGDDTATNPAGGATITLTGTNFASGARVLINTTAVGVVTVVSSTQITFTAPALAAGSYILYVVNLDGSTAIAVPGIQYSGTPAWTTAAGTLGTGYETAAVSTAVSAASDSAVTYSVVSGTLPSGVTINSSGTISGTSPLVSGSTTYTFTVRATDAELQDTDRQFSLTINPDVVTWSSANAFAIQQDAASTTTLAATSAAGQTVSYAVDTLPAGLTLSGATVSGTATTAGTTTTTATATAAVTGKTAQQTITWTVSIAADGYFPYTTLLLNAETSVQPFLADASTNNFQLTAFGDTKPNNFNPYTPGYYSNYFDGNGDWLSTSSTALNTSDFTIEFWMNGASASDRYIFVLGNDWGDATGVQFIQYSGSFALVSGDFNLNGIGSIPPLNTWAHIAIVRSGVNTKLYVNGVSTNAGIGSSATDLTATQIRICNGTGGYWPNLEGYISNLRIVKGTALYTANFTPPTQPLTAISGTVLLTCQSNRFLDASTNAFAITKNGDTKVSSFDPFMPNSSYATYGSTYFDGTGDYVRVPASSNLSFSTDFTIECWVNTSTTSLDPYGRRLWSFGDGAAFYLDAPFYNGSSITPNMCIQIASTGIVITGTRPVADGQWHHVALTRAGSSMRLFVDGIQSGSTYTNSSAFTAGATNGMFIGCLGAGVGGFLQGNVSDFRVVNGTALYTADFTPPTQPITAVANTSLLTLQTNQPVNNQTFLDNSTSALTITRTGNATQGSFSPYGANWSNYFDGSGDYLSAPSNAVFGIGTDNFTVEAWIYPISWSATGSYNCILQVNGTGIYFGKNSAGFGLRHSSTTNVISYATNPVLNTWTHVAVVRSGTTITMYYNGVSVSTATYSGNFSDGTAYIGADETPGNYFTGYISNLRLTKGTAVYTSAFTPNTGPLIPTSSTSLLTCQSSNFTDNSFNNFAITRNGDTRVEKFSPFANITQTPTTNSVYFDGNGDYIVSPATAANQLTGDFTVECWFNATGISGQSGLVSIAGATNSNSTGVHIYLEGNSKVYMQITNTSNTFASSTTIASGWNHVAVVRSGSNNTLYLNGTSVATSTVTPNWVATPTISIGKAYLDAAFTNFNGYISNVRIVKDTAVYTSNFTPSTQPLTAITNTHFLACQSATIRDNSVNNFALTAVGDAKPRQQNPFGYTTSSAQDYTTSVFGGSAYFDGTDDKLTIANYPGLAFGTSDFTIQGWFYTIASATEQVFATNGWSSYAPWLIRIDSGNILRLNMSTSGGGWDVNEASLGTVTPNQWYHVAVTRISGTLRAFVNGVQQYTATLAGSLYNGSQALNVGGRSDASVPFKGYLSDVQLINGKSLYAANFVPPSAPLQAVQNTALLLNMDKAAIQDKSGKVVLETVGDAKVSTSVKKYGTSSIYFDGSDYLSANSMGCGDLGTGDFTIEYWMNSSASGSYSGPVGTQEVAGAATAGMWRCLNRFNNANGIYFAYTSGGTFVDVTFTTTNYNDNAWHHVAYVKSGTSLRAYVDGVQVGSAVTVTQSLSSGKKLTLAYNPQDNAYYTGYIDDLRITKGYARYTANFTPPAQALLTK